VVVFGWDYILAQLIHAPKSAAAVMHHIAEDPQSVQRQGVVPSAAAAVHSFAAGEIAITEGSFPPQLGSHRSDNVTIVRGQLGPSRRHCVPSHGHSPVGELTHWEYPQVAGVIEEEAIPVHDLVKVFLPATLDAAQERQKVTARDDVEWVHPDTTSGQDRLGRPGLTRAAATGP
jgi:hypothetical protein